MSRPAVKTDESHASGASVASPFDAYSFPVSSPSEADLEPVAPSPQEAADGAEVCEAKNFLRQLAAGRTTTPNSAAPGQQSNFTGLVGLGLGISFPLIYMGRSRENFEGLTPADIQHLKKARSAIEEAKRLSNMSTEGASSPISPMYVEALYIEAFSELNAIAWGKPSNLLYLQNLDPFTMYLTSLEGKVRAGIFDPQNPDSLQLVPRGRLMERPEEFQTILWSKRNELETSLGWLETWMSSQRAEGRPIPPSLVHHQYSLHKMLAAIALKLGRPQEARDHSDRAMESLKFQDKVLLTGSEELIKLQLEILKALPQNRAIEKDYASVGRLLAEHQDYAGAAEAALRRFRLFVEINETDSENLKTSGLLYGDEVFESLTDFARAMAKLSTAAGSTDAAHLDIIAEAIGWLKEKASPEFALILTERITGIFNEAGALRDAAFTVSLCKGACDQAVQFMNRAIEQGIPKKGGLSIEDIRKQLAKASPNFSQISPERQLDIAAAVLMATGKNGSLQEIIKDGAFIPGGVAKVFRAIGVVNDGVSKTLESVGVGREEGRRGKGGERRGIEGRIEAGR